MIFKNNRRWNNQSSKHVSQKFFVDWLGSTQNDSQKIPVDRSVLKNAGWNDFLKQSPLEGQEFNGSIWKDARTFL